VSRWAIENQECVAGIAGIYPVFDLRTYPGLENAASAYGLSAQQLEAKIDQVNPIAEVAQLAEARIPVFLIHGDEDAVVPLPQNSAEFVRQYEAQGAQDLVQLVIAKGQGHNFWEGFFRCQALVDFSIQAAHRGTR
jgi:pimeloyl-ACP methyl ester carboxylesterase